MALTEDWLTSGPFQQPRFEPRASRIAITHRADIDVELWVGGSDTAIGEPLELEHLEGAWLIDCAGELPPDFRSAAAACFARVFPDIEVVPSSYERIAELAREIAAAVLGELHAESALHAHERPLRIFVMCKQGFNRSALFAGLILRELGAPGESIVSALRQARPGALTNQTFVKLLLGE